MLCFGTPRHRLHAHANPNPADIASSCQTTAPTCPNCCHRSRVHHPQLEPPCKGRCRFLFLILLQFLHGIEMLLICSRRLPKRIVQQLPSIVLALASSGFYFSSHHSMQPHKALQNRWPSITDGAARTKPGPTRPKQYYRKHQKPLNPNPEILRTHNIKP